MALGKEKKLSEISHSIEQIKADHEYFRMILESIGFGYEELLREPWESAVVAIREYEISIGRELSDSVLKHYRKEQLIQYADLCRQYMAFGRETEQCMAGELNPRNAVWVCDTPPVFASAGCRSLPMLFTQSHIRNCMKDRIRTNSHYHGLTMEKMKRLPEALADPAVIMRSSTREDALLVVLGYRDGYAQPVVAAVIPEGKGVYGLQSRRSNFILSVYGKEDADMLVRRMYEENKVYYVNQERSKELALPLLSLRRGNKNPASLPDIIGQNRGNVNSLEEKPQKNMQRSPVPKSGTKKQEKSLKL